MRLNEPSLLEHGRQYRDLVQEAPERKKISKWPRDHFYDILSNNMAAVALVLNICLRLN